jgi:hypothetical protein
MQKCNAETTVQDFGAHEGFAPPVGFRLRDVADATEIEVAGFPAQGVLNGQVLCNWRSGRICAHVVTGPQEAGGDCWNQYVADGGRASSGLTVNPDSFDSTRRSGLIQRDSWLSCFQHAPTLN